MSSESRANQPSTDAATVADETREVIFTETEEQYKMFLFSFFFFPQKVLFHSWQHIGIMQEEL